MKKNVQKEVTIEDVKEGIICNYRQGKLLKTLLKYENNDLQKLELIEYIAYFYTNHITGQYSDEYLENELIRIGRKYIQFNPRVVNKENEILMVMTRAAEVGGHTAVVNNWIRFDKTRKYSIVFTDGTINNVPRFLVRTVKESGGRLYFLKKRGKLDKARELLKISDGFERIVLHIHMHDVIPVLAYANENWNIPVYFYNHANFLFSLGLSVSDCVLNLMEYDKWKTVKYRGVRNAEVLPWPALTIKSDCENEVSCEEQKKILAKKYGFCEDSKIILSMGSDFKYKKIIGYDFAKFAKNVIYESPMNTYFFVIGADKDSMRWKQLQKETDGKVQALGVLPRNVVSRWMKIADVFVGSFPMVSAGGDEATENGVPVVFLNTINRGKDIVMGQYRNDVTELQNYIVKIIKGNEKHIPIIGKYVEVSKTPSQWCDVLNKICEKYHKHEMQPVTSKLIIGKEEIINHQLNLNNYCYNWNDTKLSFKNRIQIKILKIICSENDGIEND